MRLLIFLALMLFCLGATPSSFASPPATSAEPAPKQVNVTADQSVEYYHEKNLYVARGNAKAVRGTLTVTGDVLTAHEREKKPDEPRQPKNATDAKSDTGDIDWMTADGHVVIVDPKQRITGDQAVYDLDKHQMIVTGKNLRYETAKEVVTATDSLEYYEDSKLAVARGHAVADEPTRHVEGDVLTAEFRDAPNGQSQLTKMTAQGHVAVITKTEPAAKPDATPVSATKPGAEKTKGGDVSRGDRAVYNADSNVAILTGDVRITRTDGTELSGDVGEVNFNNNQNRLMNDGDRRVRALLPAKTTEKATQSAAPAPTTAAPNETPAAAP